MNRAKLLVFLGFVALAAVFWSSRFFSGNTRPPPAEGLSVELGANSRRGEDIRRYSGRTDSGARQMAGSSSERAFKGRSYSEQIAETIDRMKLENAIDPRGLAALLNDPNADLAPGQRFQLLEQIAVTLAKEDKQLSLDFVDELQNFREKNLFAMAMARHLLESDPAAAVEWSKGLQDRPTQANVVNSIAREWAEKDLPQSRAWAEGITDADLKRKALEGVTWSWAKKDAQRAYEWAVKLEDGEARMDNLVLISKIVANVDPEKAAAWTLQFPEGPGQEAALQYAVRQWAAKDLSSALAWAGKIEREPIRNLVLAAIERVRAQITQPY